MAYTCRCDPSGKAIPRDYNHNLAYRSFGSKPNAWVVSAWSFNSSKQRFALSVAQKTLEWSFTDECSTRFGFLGDIRSIRVKRDWTQVTRAVSRRGSVIGAHSAAPTCRAPTKLPLQQLCAFAA
eukprot:scaffold377_cov563-Prasinococcus_capsulatus_cf.AAC.34